jgi:hypothetical protein
MHIFNKAKSSTSAKSYSGHFLTSFPGWHLLRFWSSHYVVCVVASVTIVSVSNKQTVESWRIQPSVLLNFLSSSSNVALGSAFSTGVAITWWTSATKGATFAQLHYIWDTGGGISFPSAISAGGNARKVALTTIIIAGINLLTGPLFQRATQVSTGNSRGCDP